MAKLDDWLNDNRDDLVRMASQALVVSAKSDSVDGAGTGVIVSFYEGLAASASMGDADALAMAINHWVAEDTLNFGEAIGTVSVLHRLRDVTSEFIVKKSEASDAVSLLAWLNSFVDEAAARLRHRELDARLEQAQGELEGAQETLMMLDKSKSDFIAVAAHELKTPLTLIEGYVNMLTAEFPPAEFPRVGLMLGGISNGTFRLHEIIDDMIDVSMIDMDLLQLHLQPVWLSRLMQAVVDELAEAAKARNLTLTKKDFEGEDNPVFGDPERLRQAFYNIVVNAIKFTPDGGSVTISAEVDENTRFDVQIADTGIGIESDNLDRIFDKLTQLHDVALHSSSKTNFKGGGPGLGLAIARGILLAHDGDVWAESPGYDEDKCPGTTFHIIVPIRPHGAQGDESMGQLFEATRDGLSELDSST